jgi:F-type H+-transporting ATPase subunit gamma
VDVVYNEFKSISQRQIAVEQFLPIPAVSPEKGRAAREYICEPGGKEILDALVPRYLSFALWRVLLESNAAEEGARMAAMESATDNAEEIISTLQLQYNKARQSAITTELLEIVSGAEALASSE